VHMQLRLSVSAASSDGTGAMNASPAQRDPVVLRRGALATLLEQIAAAGINLKIAGGTFIEGAGELVLACEDDQMPDLEKIVAPYNPRRVEVEYRELPDQPGELAKLIRSVSKDGYLVNEIFVGSGEANGLVPVQVTRMQHVEGEETWADGS
jgi:hypothetical protein